MTSARVMPVSRWSAAEQRGRRLLVAFTLLELLIVVAIIAVMAAAGVPAIRNIIYTSTASMAETQLKLSLNAARDLAIRNAISLQPTRPERRNGAAPFWRKCRTLSAR